MTLSVCFSRCFPGVLFDSRARKLEKIGNLSSSGIENFRGDFGRTSLKRSSKNERTEPRVRHEWALPAIRRS